MGHGGFRVGAGRKPAGGRRSTPHVRRPMHHRSRPVHVAMRSTLRGLRNQLFLTVLEDSIRRSNQRWRGLFRVVQYSLQRNHVHLLVEARDKAALQEAMRGLAVSLARRANRRLHRRGRFWQERWFGRALETARQVRNALVYVLGNAHKHENALAAGIDPFSSALWFDGFRGHARPLACKPPGRTDTGPPTALAETWLLSRAWRRLGLLSVFEGPAGGVAAR